MHAHGGECKRQAGRWSYLLSGGALVVTVGTAALMLWAHNLWQRELARPINPAPAPPPVELNATPAGNPVAETTAPAPAPPGATDAIAVRVNALEQQVAQLTQLLGELVKVRYVAAPADPDLADCIEREPLEGGENFYHYLVVPTAGIQEVLEVLARVPPEGTWQETPDWEIRGGQLYLLAGQYYTRTDGDTTTREYVKQRQEFKLVYR